MLWAVRAHLSSAVPGAKFNLITFGLHSADLSRDSATHAAESRAAVALSRTLFMENRAAYGASIDLPDSRRLPMAVLQAAVSSSEYALRLRHDRCFTQAL